MNELPWGSPENLGKLTLPQLACLGSEKPPTAKKRCTTQEEYLAALAEQERAEAAWNE